MRVRSVATVLTLALGVAGCASTAQRPADITQLSVVDAAQLIRDKKTNRLVPIIAVTAFSDIKDEALKAGCADVIYKPVQPELLREMLDHYTSDTVDH